MVTKDKNPRRADLENLQSSPALPKTAAAGLSARRRPIGNFSLAPKAQLILIFCTAIFIAAAISHFVAAWLGLPKPTPAYRRIGSQNGPQVFCAGSSLLQFALSWPEIAAKLGQGIESWGVGGSTPTEWEVFQNLATNTNLMIVGVSVYDLNEYHLCDSGANIVPIVQTIRDLWHDRMNWQFSKRLLSQYPLAYLRKTFPTAGSSDAILVGLRRKLPTRLRAAAAAEERANSMVLPQQAVMDFGGSTEKLSDWPPAKTLRRLALMRSEIQGRHAFSGPKQLALRRMLQRAVERGRVIVVVLPVAPIYAHEFLKPEDDRNFESVLAAARRDFPQSLFVRLDQVAALKTDECFSDPVHLNGAGKQIATETFLKDLQQHFNLP